jgi:prepilin-type N-terminal cleavage/methylation domain-containing protein
MTRKTVGSEFRAARQRAKLAGFTLAEILVALALIALLAAVLLPTVAGQILKGDAGRVMQDVQAVRSGIEQFLADVHRYPGKYSDLSKKIVASDAGHVDINGAQYPAGLVANWAGPYVTKDTASAVVMTGFGGSIQNGFFKVANTNGINYVTIRILGITTADFDRIDTQVDGPSATTTIARNTGLLRLFNQGGVGTVDTVAYLATPIQ